MKNNNYKTKSGFVALVGRPNVGKSSLMNTFVGQKITIISDKPQTTRNQLRGILTDRDYQIIWLDTPGLHRPLHKLGTEMNEKAKSALKSVDIVFWVLDASKGLTAADEIIAQDIRKVDIPVMVVWNKIDLNKDLASLPKIDGFDKVYHVSAHTRQGVSELLAATVSQLPPGPFYYPPDMITDHPERFIVGELIREQVLMYTDEEVPHSIAIQIEQMKERSNGGFYIDAIIYVERDSQKGIIIGSKGERLKKIGQGARQSIEDLLDTKVYLNLWVKVRKNWRNHSGSLREFGYLDRNDS